MADLQQLVSQLASAVAGKAALGNKIAFDIPGLGGIVLDGTGTANEVKAADPQGDVVIALDPDTLTGLLNRSVNPMAAFTQGKIKIRGNMMLAQKLVSLFS